MSVTLVVLWLVVGHLPAWPPWPWPQRWPPPQPLNPWTFKIAGMVGAVVGGLIHLQVFPFPEVVPIPPINIVYSLVGAYLGAVLATQVYGLTQRPKDQG